MKVTVLDKVNILPPGFSFRYSNQSYKHESDFDYNNTVILEHAKPVTTI